MEVLKLIASRNRCLEKLLHCCNTFIESTKDSHLNKLSSFEMRRSSIFKAITLYDKKISTLLISRSIDSSFSEIKAHASALLSHGDTIIKAVFEKDRTILELIENEKNRILGELRDTQKHQSIVSKFKSKWISESGEKLDGRL